MKFLSYVRALIHQWENGIITSDDFVRLVRKAVIEEDAVLDRILETMEDLEKVKRSLGERFLRH